MSPIPLFVLNWRQRFEVFVAAESIPFGSFGGVVMGISKTPGGKRGLWIRKTRWLLGSRGFRMGSVRFGMFPLWIFALVFLFLSLSGFCADGIFAGPSPSSLKDDVRWAVGKLAGPMGGVLAKTDFNAIQATLDKILSEAEKEGKPIRFGVGVLDREGLAVAGRYIVGSFKMEDFSKFNFFAKAFKRKKILQDRLYFQGGSELLIVCVPLLQKKTRLGALVFGFDPSQIQKDYVLNAEQFMALDFNK
jgi:hypothetical protein